MRYKSTENLSLTFRIGFLLLLFFGRVSLASEVPRSGPAGVIWEAEISQDGGYSRAVETLLQRFEQSVEQVLGPASRASVGIKVNTRAGRGLGVPLPLLRAVIESLEQRGFSRKNILIVDYSAHSLRQTGILPALSRDENAFEGCPVLALETGHFYDPDWYYDNPLPPSLQQRFQGLPSLPDAGQLLEGDRERKSFLPAPLLFEVDFWVNLAVAIDDPALGIDGALSSATIWNVSNSQRFLNNPATASAAIAEIAAIPELSERMVLHFVSLEHYQFIGGPHFKSIYTRSEPLLWSSADPVAIDRMLYERINAHRRLQGFPEIYPLPAQLAFAASLGLGHYQLSRIRVEPVK